MVSSLVIKNCLEELRRITKIGFSVQDTEGNVVAQTEGMTPPEKSMAAGFASSMVDSQIIGDSFLLKARDDEEVVYVLTAQGESEYTFMLAKVAVSELENLIVAYKEKYDRNNFFQNLFLDNLLLVDIYNRAKKLHISNNMRRAVIVLEVGAEQSVLASELLTGLFTVQNGDYVTQVDENSLILVKGLGEEATCDEVERAAGTAVDMLESETMIRARAACGTIVDELKDLSRSYKEAKMAMDVEKIFYAQRHVISYNELGIGRLIYQLPVSLCKMFLQEVFGENGVPDIDSETLATINTFFENNLNVSETARQLFVHRNTLVYRLEKLQKSTGLDIRTFEDAMTLKIALMVRAYMMFTILT